MVRAVFRRAIPSACVFIACSRPSSVKYLDLLLCPNFLSALRILVRAPFCFFVGCSGADFGRTTKSSKGRSGKATREQALFPMQAGDGGGKKKRMNIEHGGTWKEYNSNTIRTHRQNRSTLGAGCDVPLVYLRGTPYAALGRSND